MSLILAIFLLAQATPAPVPVDENVLHKPLDKVTRGQTVRIGATIKDQAKIFTPLVFARRGGDTRFHGYPMVPRGGDRYQARLPQSFLTSATFEYFVEVRLEGGGTKSVGSSDRPFVVKVEQAVIVPARISISSDTGATVGIDGKELGNAPIEVELPPGKHTVVVNHVDGRGAEQQIDVQSGRNRKLHIALPRGGGPGTLTLLSDPPGARVLIDGQRLGTTPYQGEVPPGKHKVVVEREGFIRQERDVTFRDGHDVEISFPLASLPKDPAISVESDPAGATVVIDGKTRGVTPFIGPLEAGRHQVVLKKQGRREVASDFEMPENRDLSMRLVLAVPGGSGEPLVIVASQPDGATVLVDGEEVGETPWAGEVKPGQRKLTVKSAGFVTEERKVEARANRELEVAFSLQRLPGPAKVVIETEPAEADVGIDGKLAGRSPVTVEMQPGEHDIEAGKQGFKGVAQKITVDNGQSASIRLALAPASRKPESIIAVATEPAGARLYIDNRLMGETPLKVKSFPGDHDVRVALDGFRQKASKIKLPQKDFELRVAVTLKRLREEAVAVTTDRKALAKNSLKRAQNCDKQGDWECALKHFRAVYDYKPVPEILFNIAQVRRKKGDFQEAATAYRAYVKERPSGQLSDRARQWAEKCEAVAKGGDKNIAEDDTEPPKIQHVALAKALRNQGLRIEAVITDNSSGVFNPQACWRNVYNTEYECTQLALVGSDQYAVDVPAKAVTDGFAYFLEAFDNASNGPARSGAPSVPHSVAIEEPAAPEPAVTATQRTGDGLAQGPAETAPEGGGAVTAGYSAGGGPAAGGAVGSTPGSPAGQNLANQGASNLLGNTRRVDTAEHPWLLLVHLGAEQAREKYTDSVVDGRLGIELSRRVNENFLALVQIDARTVRQPYRTSTPVSGQVASAQHFDEQRYSLGAAFGYDLGALLLGGDRMTLAVMGLAEYQRWQNQLFPANYFGLGGQVQARLLLFSPFAIVGGAGYTWNLAGNDPGNAVGTPRSDLAVRAGLEYAFTPRYAVEVTYRTDVLALANDYRFTNGLSVGLGTSF